MFSYYFFSYYFFPPLHRIYCSMLGSTKDDTIILEESDENIFLSIRNTKDFSFITINVFSDSSSKVLLLKFLPFFPVVWIFLL